MKPGRFRCHEEWDRLSSLRWDRFKHEKGTENDVINAHVLTAQICVCSAVFAVLLQNKEISQVRGSPPASPPVNTVPHHTYNWVMVTGTKTLISPPPHNVYFVTGHLVKRLIVLINLPRVHLDLPSGIFQVSGSSHQLSLFWFDICVFYFRFCPADSPGQLATGDAVAQGRSACPRESFLCFPMSRAPAEDGC